MPKKFSDVSKEVRQQKIYNLLKQCTDEDSALSVQDIFKRLYSDGIEVSQKTVTRDLSEDMVSTHKIMCTEGRPARFYTDPSYKPDFQLSFSESELHTIALALNSFKEMAPSFLKDLALKTETILLSKVPKSIAKDFDQVKSISVFTPAYRSESDVEDSDTFEKIMKALRQGVMIRCRNVSPYQTDNEAKVTRSFAPLFHHLAGSEHYVIVYDPEVQKPKRLKITRLEDVELIEENFDLSLRDKFRDQTFSIGGFGGTQAEVIEYEVTCDKLMATLFQEKKIHQTQTIKKCGENFIISFKANRSYEIVRDLAGWAPHIKKVAPYEIKQELEEIWEAGLKLVA